MDTVGEPPLRKSLPAPFLVVGLSRGKSGLVHSYDRATCLHLAFTTPPSCHFHHPGIIVIAAGRPFCFCYQMKCHFPFGLCVPVRADAQRTPSIGISPLPLVFRFPAMPRSESVLRPPVSALVSLKRERGEKEDGGKLPSWHLGDFRSTPHSLAILNAREGAMLYLNP